jgi:hypothetical protein
LHEFTTGVASVHAGGGAWKRARDERRFIATWPATPRIIRARPERDAGAPSKNPLLSNTLQRFVRKRWNHRHNFAFLLDSQAKFP